MTLTHLRHEAGRTAISMMMTIIGGVALFIVMASIGYAMNAPADEIQTLEVTEYTPQPIAADEAIDEPSGEVIADDIVRTIRESGAATDEEIEAASENVGASGGSGGRRTITEPATVDPSDDTADGATDGSGSSGTSSEEAGAAGEPAPVPEDVLEEGGSFDGFIDWDSIDLIEPPIEVRIDLCAGSTPGLPALPGCPEGTGATIVPIGDPIDGPPLVSSYGIFVYGPHPTYNTFAPDCNSSDDVFRILVVANRPSDFDIAVWNNRPGGGTTPATTYNMSTSLEDATAWEAAVTSDPTTPPRINHCIEIPDAEFGHVEFHVVGTSVYVPDDGATAEASGHANFWSATGGRPPSGLVAATPTTLYVRAWNQSSVEEQIFVQARPQSPEGCDNSGDIALVGSGPGSVQGVRDTVIPMDTDRTGWPFGPTWDELEIHRLTLEPGVPYDVCIFWVTDTGPSFNPASVVRTEAAQVVPPSPNEMTIAIAGAGFADLGDDPRVNQVSVVAIVSGPSTFDPENPTIACRGSWSTNSTAGEFDIPLTGANPGVLCTTTDTSSLILQRGIRVTVSAVDSLGDRYHRTSWVTLHPNLFQCGTDCGEQRVLVEIPMPWVAPRAVTGSFEWPVEVDSDAIVPIDEDALGEEGPPVGSVNLEFIFSPTGDESRRWSLGEIGEQDQSAGSLPVRPQLDVTYSYPTVASGPPTQPGIYFPDGFPGVPHAAVAFRVEADRPVTLSASISGYEDSEICLRPGVSAPSVSASEPRQVHTFRFTGLCPHADYNINVVATDETGTTAEIFGVGPADGTTPVVFTAAPLRLAIEGEMVVDPAGYGPGGTESALHVNMEDMYVVDLGGRLRSSVSEVTPTGSASAEETATGWTFDDPYGGTICASPESTGGELDPITLRVVSDQPADFGETAAVTFRVRRWSGPTQYRTTPSGLLYRCTSVPSGATLYEAYEAVSVEDLLGGVSFTSDDGLYTVTLRGHPVS